MEENKNLGQDESEKSAMTLLQDKYLPCLKLKTDEERFNCQYPSEVNDEGFFQSFSCLEKFKSNSALIPVIYFLIIFALSLKINIVVSSFLFRGESSNLSHFSEWVINAPPMLGVLGTVIAFSIMVSSGGDISELFQSTFYDAAKTTVLGGSVYVINLFLSSVSNMIENENT